MKQTVEQHRRRSIDSIKSAVTKRINKLRNTPGKPVWQRNYYEHIIRNENDLNRIRKYILNNPEQWQFDHENPACTGMFEIYPNNQTENRRGTRRPCS